jgi:DNA repair protein RecO (recombination protein O)
MDIYQKKTREIQRIKEFRLTYPYVSIPYDMVKTAQNLFIAEILNKIIIEEEQNPALYNFLESSLLFFDLMDKGKSVFHIWFLTHLTGYLGIMPDIRRMDREWFDMHLGTMVAGEPPHPEYMKPGISSLFRSIMDTGIRELAGFKADQSEKTMLLDKILEYYTLHFSNLSGLKSPEILREVFH